MYSSNACTFCVCTFAKKEFAVSYCTQSIVSSIYIPSHAHLCILDIHVEFGSVFCCPSWAMRFTSSHILLARVKILIEEEHRECWRIIYVLRHTYKLAHRSLISIWFRMLHVCVLVHLSGIQCLSFCMCLQEYIHIHVLAHACMDMWIVCRFMYTRWHMHIRTLRCRLRPKSTCMYGHTQDMSCTYTHTNTWQSLAEMQAETEIYIEPSS